MKEELEESDNKQRCTDIRPPYRVIVVADGQLLDGLSAYWFAWVAFHPETEVFTAD